MTASSVKKSSASDALLVPGATQLHLWLCHRDAVPDSDHFLRSVLSRYTAIAARRLEITRGKHGKPELLFPASPLAFNLSDSAEYLAMVISGGAAVGVDLEYCDPGRDVLKLARRFFSTAELADLEACPAARRAGRFYEYWTLKESHIKSFGGSLGRELEAACFALLYPGGAPNKNEPGRIVTPDTAPAEAAWYGLMQPLADYRLAVCCRAPLDFTRGLRLYQWPDLSADGSFLRLLASSSAAAFAG